MVLESVMIPKTEIDSKEYDSGNTKPEGFKGHSGIPKTEMDTEESDSGSYASCSSRDGEEMEHDSNDFYSEPYMDDEDPVCFCGLPAKQRMSTTAKNPNRWFFNCAKRNYNTQCGYFQWYDELFEYETNDEVVDSNHLEHEDEEMVLSEEKSSLTCQASTASIQVDRFKEMDLFPPYKLIGLRRWTCFHSIRIYVFLLRNTNHTLVLMAACSPLFHQGDSPHVLQHFLDNGSLVDNWLIFDSSCLPKWFRLYSYLMFS